MHESDSYALLNAFHTIIICSMVLIKEAKLVYINFGDMSYNIMLVLLSAVM